MKFVIPCILIGFLLGCSTEVNSDHIAVDPKFPLDDQTVITKKPPRTTPVEEGVKCGPDHCVRYESWRLRQDNVEWWVYKIETLSDRRP